MNKFFSRVAGAARSVVASASIAVASSLATASMAMATTSTSVIDVSAMSPDITMVGTLGGAICTGLLGIWGVRKVIKLVNRS